MSYRLLDLFCGAGGAAMGYHRAGFEVVGVDLAPQRNFPFLFIQADAFEFARRNWRHFDAIHASPPCQSYSDLAKRNGNADKWPRLVEPVRDLLWATGLPWVIENVEGAPLIDPIVLCGTMFPGLRVLRHRLFESNVPLTAPDHRAHPLVFTYDKRKAHFGKLDQDTAFVQVTGGGNCTIANARDAMGIDWMTKHEINEWIPPAYTAYVGQQVRCMPGSGGCRMTAIAPGSDEWLRTISPSKVAAILGLSRWESAFRLWHRMKGLVPPEAPKDAFNVGHAAEHMLAELWRIENPGWQLSPGEVQVKHNRFGFPVLATPDRRARRGAHRRIVEFKIARDLSDLEEWGDVNLDGEIPVDYQAQLLAQMHFTGYNKHAAHLMVMGPYFQHRTYVVEYDPAKAMAIEDKVAEFWDSLESDVPPALDDTVATYDCIRALNPHIREDQVAQVDPILAADYLETDRQIKALKDEYQGLKNRVAFALGDAKTGVAGTLPVASRRKQGKGTALYPATKTVPADLRALLNQPERTAS